MKNTSGNFTSVQDVLAMLQSAIEAVFTPQLTEFLQLILRSTERSAAGELILPPVASRFVSSTMQLEALLKLRARVTLHAFSLMLTGDAKLTEDRLTNTNKFIIFINCYYLLSCLHLPLFNLLLLLILLILLS